LAKEKRQNNKEIIDCLTRGAGINGHPHIKI
jgi:hypothetical protein